MGWPEAAVNVASIISSALMLIVLVPTVLGAIAVVAIVLSEEWDKRSRRKRDGD